MLESSNARARMNRLSDPDQPQLNAAKITVVDGSFWWVFGGALALKSC